MSSKKILVTGLVIVASLFILSAPIAFAQSPCEADFDGDQDVDTEDLKVFLEDFGRNQYNDPCPQCSSNYALRMIERSDEFECLQASSCTYTVNCEPGEVLTGGGFQLNDPGVGVLDIWESKPDLGENRWRVTTMNYETVTIRFSIYSMCATISN